MLRRLAHVRRPALAAASLVGIVALMFAWAHAIERHPVGSSICVAEGAAADGRFEVMSLGYVTGHGEGSYRARKGKDELVITTSVFPLPPIGADISIGGHCRDAGLGMMEDWRELHPLFRYKMHLGLAAVIFLALMMRAWFGFGRDGASIRG